MWLLFTLHALVHFDCADSGHRQIAVNVQSKNALGVKCCIAMELVCTYFEHYGLLYQLHRLSGVCVS